MKISSCSAQALWILSFLVVVSMSGGEMRIQPRWVGTNAVSLTFDCATDAYYQILAAGSLKSGAWAVTNMGLGSLSQASWTGSFPQASLYLRVRAVPRSAPRDEDGDGLDDVFELSDSSFDPLDASDGLRDTDGDGMPDGWEMMYGLLPGSNSDAMDDSDNDGLSNLQEFLFGTSPFARDTDRDGLSDEEEVTLRLDPLYNPLQRRQTSLIFTYDDQDRLERVESPASSIQMGYDAAANLIHASCSREE